METFLRCFVHACPKKWLNWIPLAEFWYNSIFHSSIGRSPFEAIYGYAPRVFGLSATNFTSIGDLEQWLSERRVMPELIKQHLNRVVLRMKQQVDKGRFERHFMLEDWVFVKLQPYVQTSLAPRSNQKLAFKYFGPFSVVQRIGKVVYRLDLPSSSSIHPIFHVSQLKKMVGSNVDVSFELHVELAVLQFPEKILQKRLATQGVQSVQQGLIKWLSTPESLATWEDLEPLKQRFPVAPTWGQVAPKEDGIVTELATLVEGGGRS
jgi:hypothetical protein